MSARSFRDRYGSLQPSPETRPADAAQDDQWPLPDGGRLVATSSGSAVVSDVHYHGVEIERARDLIQQAGILSDVNSAIFVDTETTGLSGGTGTHVFLVGIGMFERDSFRVRQFFLRHPGEERALLDAIESDVRGMSSIVTYNGRTFDIPMLETRYRMHHRLCEFPEHHVDLLHPVRAVWKHRLPSCSLGTVEQHVLGVNRVDDAPGWMIPQLYFSYLQSRQINTLQNVFNHNRQDIVSLARLSGIVHSYQRGFDSPIHPTDRLGVALMHLRAGDIDRALPVVIEAAGMANVPSELRFRAAREVSIALKRSHRFDEAVGFWQERLVDPTRAIRLLAAEELAKYLEHRARDHRMALDVARRAADGAALAGDAATYRSFQKRIARLELKIARTADYPGQVDHVDEVESL